MKTISQLTNKDCIHCETEKEDNNNLQVIATFILIFLAAILSVLLFTPYTILISCDNWHIYERYWLFPLEEVKKLQETLSTGDNNCNVEMFAR